MKIEISKVKKLRITELLNGPHRLDPVTVYAENFGNGQGKIVVECYGRSWSAYWGAMGCDLEDFFLSAGTDYIISYFDSAMRPVAYDATQAADRLKEIIIKRRLLQRDGYKPKDWNYESLDKDDARELWDKVEDEHFYDDPAGNSNLICEVVGHDEWWNALPESPNPDYLYLQRIINAVKDAFKQLHAPQDETL